MISVCLYFQVHQPYRTRNDYSFFDIGLKNDYFDEGLNREVMQRVAEKCYLPAGKKLLALIEKLEGKFKFAFSISGVALEQMEEYSPASIEIFQKLVNTGCVEILSETYHHSLSHLFSEKEFKAQVKLHKDKVQKLFGVKPTAFRNTELLYDNRMAEIVEEMGYKVVLTEGANRILGWRTPNFLYQPKPCSKLALLLKNYRLSDDLAFRFSNETWEDYPLTADKYSKWIHKVAGNGEVVGLFMDYETFGEHQWEETGIFDFLEEFPKSFLKKKDTSFVTPTEAASLFQPMAKIDVPHTISWADLERDTSAWMGNSMQDSALSEIYNLESQVKKKGDPELTAIWRKLLTSDHFYYMCTKWSSDGEVHRYFTHFENAESAWICFQNIVNDFRRRL